MELLKHDRAARRSIHKLFLAHRPALHCGSTRQPTAADPPCVSAALAGGTAAFRRACYAAATAATTAAAAAAADSDVSRRGGVGGTQHRLRAQAKVTVPTRPDSAWPGSTCLCPLTSGPRAAALPSRRRRAPVGCRPADGRAFLSVAARQGS